MRLDPLQQYAKLYRQLTEEKTQLETRLSQINQVLGAEHAPNPVTPSSTPPAVSVRHTRRGRKPKGSNEMSMREAVLKALSNGPLARKDLVHAVEEVGYKFNTKNPLNSIGSILYAKNTPVKNKAGKFYLSGSELSPTPSAAGNGDAQPVAGRRKKRRKVSAEARARMSAAQKARWAK